MNDQDVKPGRLHFVGAPTPLGVTLATLLLSVVFAGPLAAADRPPFAARAGVESAAPAALAWAQDAVLVYLENDEDLDARGAAERWGYLYYSPSLQKARAYSVRDGKVLVAEDLEMKFEAPPLSPTWIDSEAALQVADQSSGREFCRDHQGRPTTMLLMRGAFHTGEPDQTTWTIVYTSPNAPSLWVVVDAAEGKVRRTWRG